MFFCRQKFSVYALVLGVMTTVLESRSFAAGKMAQETLSSFEDSVVMLTTSSQGWDAHNPWSKREPQTISSLGVIVSGGRILTTAFAVRGAMNIEGRRFGESKRFELDVLVVDYEINLALLKPKNTEFTQGMRPLTIGGAVAPGTGLTIIKDRDPFRLTQMQGRITEVSVLRSATSAYAATVYQIETRGQGLGWAEPVVSGNTLLALTTGQDEGGLYAIPSTLVKRFVDEATSSKYRGFPALGISVRPLIDPNQRHDLGADNVRGGVRVVKVFATSPFADKLQVDDVLVSVEGYTLSGYGDVLWPVWGKVSMQVILNTLYPGHKIRLVVARHGRKITLEAELTRFSSNRFMVPHYRFGEVEPHLIFGGIVLQELTRDYMMIWGKDWQENAPLEFLYTYEYENDPPKQEGDRFVILNRVLPDEFNRGYESLDNNILVEANGQKIRSLAALQKALDQPVERNGKKYAVFKFSGGGGEIVLGYDDLDNAQRRIAKNFGIPSSSSFFTENKTSTPK